MKKITKGMRIQLTQKALKNSLSYFGGEKNSNYTNVEDVVPKDVYPWDVENIASDYVDEFCKTNYGLTEFGIWLYNRCKSFEKALYEEWAKFGFLN